MRTSRWLTALLVVGFAASLAPAQGPRTTDERPPIATNGTEMFRLLLHLAELKPTQFNRLYDQSSGVAYRDVVLIIFGTASYNDIGWAQNVIANGGAVLIATEQTRLQLWNSNITNFPRLTFDFRTVNADEDAPRYQGLASHPYIVPILPEEVPGLANDKSPIWKVFGGLDRVAANFGSSLTRLQGVHEFRFPLARYPKGSYYTNSGVELPDDYYFAVGGEGAPQFGNSYRFLAVANHSAFTNSMLVDESLDNFKMSANIVEYLKDANGRNRQYCIFVENGRTHNRFDDLAYALKDPTPPLPQFSVDKRKLVDLGNKIIENLQADDGLNTKLLGRDPEAREQNLRRYITTLLMLGCVYIALRLIMRQWAVRHPLDSPLPPVTGQPATPDPANPAGIFNRRQRELFRRDNLYEPVRDTLREWFATVGAPEDAPEKLPKIVVTDVVRRSETLRKALADLWKIAHGPAVRVSVDRWSSLEPLFVRARRAFDDGKWRFAS